VFNSNAIIIKNTAIYGIPDRWEGDYTFQCYYYVDIVPFDYKSFNGFTKGQISQVTFRECATESYFAQFM